MKYEYNQLYISLRTDLNHIGRLNTMGIDSWEMVSVVKVDNESVMYVFKRPLIENSKQLLNENLTK